MLRKIGSLFRAFFRSNAVLLPEGQRVEPDSESPFYRGLSDGSLNLKPDVTALDGKDSKGRQVIVLQKDNGQVTGIDCTCPAGYFGGCLQSVRDTPTGQIATCSGTCKHGQIDDEASCFWKEVTIDRGLAERLIALAK